jgi:lysozyme family protein
MNPFKKGTVPWYEFEYQRMTFDNGFEHAIAAATLIVMKGREQYKALEAKTGVPWRLIACIHNMECGCNFKGYLGNGQLIIGTSRRSTIVPKGRGPFATFEAGALDALRLDGLTGISGWSIGMELKQAEIFNGTGYLKYHPTENSPYIWAQTSVNDGSGKYTGDGHYDPNANANAQTGVAAIYKQIELWGKV